MCIINFNTFIIIGVYFVFVVYYNLPMIKTNKNCLLFFDLRALVFV